jgi:kynurenine formamidase
MPLPPDLQELATRVSNWGRWGGDDERGTLNLITPDALRRGAACVRRGVCFSLALPVDEDGPQTGGVPGRENARRTMFQLNLDMTGDGGVAFNDDKVEMGLQAATHWDALAHVSHAGTLFNGFPAASVTEAGAARVGIDKAGPIVTRGVLLDVARRKGVDRLEPGYGITADDLEDTLRSTDVTLLAGDAVLVRTGQMAVLKAGDRDDYRRETSGLAWPAVEWFHDYDVAAVATDTFAFEVFEPWPPKDPGRFCAVHVLDLCYLGLLQGQLWDLDELAADCDGDRVYEFLLSATPLPLTGGCGSPVTPVAVK